MKYILLLVFMLLPLSIMAKGEEQLSKISQLIWKNRIILIWSAEEESYKKSLVEYDAKIKDRDIIWFIIDGSSVLTNYTGKVSPDFAKNTTKAYADTQNKVLLIGKDGGIKNKSDELSLDKIFQEVDSMPMRINEMRKKENGDH